MYTSVKEVALQSPGIGGGGWMGEDEDAKDEAAALLYWKLPRAFTSKRHIERIEGFKFVAPAWRMKERVRE